MPTPQELKRTRSAADLTQRETAALLHITPHAVRSWEQGRYPMPPDRWELLQQKLAGVSAEQVLRDKLAEATRRFRKQYDGAALRGNVDREMDTGAARDAWYAQILRLALASMRPRPTVDQIAAWTGLGAAALRSWLRPSSHRAHRPMPRYAIKLVLYAFRERDESGQDWGALLRACR